jgi:hypothetical protein
MANSIVSGSPHKLPRIASPKPEWGDVRDVQRIFGIKISHLYQLMNDGLVESVLVKGRGKSRGKRLFKFASIRKMLAEQQQKKEGASV